MTRPPSILCIIPARGKSKRIPGKNIRPFAGKPLVAHTILQARKLSFVDRIVVDTDSPKIAAVAKKYGAEVPFLRSARLATDVATITDAVLHLLARLEKAEGYKPDYVLLLQTTSPLREVRDIQKCWQRMKRGGEDAVVTVARTHPQLFVMDKKGTIVRANKRVVRSPNMQSWPTSYLLNGCFAYIIRTTALKREKTFVPKRTAAVECPRWRSVDLDTPEDWVMAELIYKNRKSIASNLTKFV